MGGGGGINATLRNFQTVKLLLVASETIIIHKQKDYSELLMARIKLLKVYLHVSNQFKLNLIKAHLHTRA